MIEITELLSVTLTGIAIPLFVVLGGAMMILLSMSLIAAMAEKGFRPTPVKKRNTWLSMLDTSREVNGITGIPTVTSFFTTG